MNKLRLLLALLFLLGLAEVAFAQDQTPLFPDTALTPGVTRRVTVEEVCTPGSSKKVRNVPTSEKNAVYREYGITHHAPGDFEVDHLISLELGGSNDIKNLWPESYRTKPYNAHVKDAYENWLHKAVCSHSITLEEAQRRISHNWIKGYLHDVASTE